MTNDYPLLEKIAGRALRRAKGLLEEVESFDSKANSLYLLAYEQYQRNVNRISKSRTRFVGNISTLEDAEDLFIEELAVISLKWRINICDHAIKALRASTFAVRIAQLIGTQEQKREAMFAVSDVRPYIVSYYPTIIQDLIDENKQHAIVIEQKIMGWERRRLLGSGRFNIREDIAKEILDKELFIQC